MKASNSSKGFVEKFREAVCEWVAGKQEQEIGGIKLDFSRALLAFLYRDFDVEVCPPKAVVIPVRNDRPSGLDSKINWDDLRGKMTEPRDLAVLSHFNASNGAKKLGDKNWGDIVHLKLTKDESYQIALEKFQTNKGLSQEEINTLDRLYFQDGEQALSFPVSFLGAPILLCYIPATGSNNNELSEDFTRQFRRTVFYPLENFIEAYLVASMYELARDQSSAANFLTRASSVMMAKRATFADKDLIKDRPPIKGMSASTDVEFQIDGERFILTLPQYEYTRRIPGGTSGARKSGERLKDERKILQLILEDCCQYISEKQEHRTTQGTLSEIQKHKQAVLASVHGIRMQLDALASSLDAAERLRAAMGLELNLDVMFLEASGKNWHYDASSHQFKRVESGGGGVAALHDWKDAEKSQVNDAIQELEKAQQDKLLPEVIKLVFGKVKEMEAGSPEDRRGMGFRLLKSLSNVQESSGFINGAAIAMAVAFAARDRWKISELGESCSAHFGIVDAETPAGALVEFLGKVSSLDANFEHRQGVRVLDSLMATCAFMAEFIAPVSGRKKQVATYLSISKSCARLDVELDKPLEREAMRLDSNAARHSLRAALAAILDGMDRRDVTFLTYELAKDYSRTGIYSHWNGQKLTLIWAAKQGERNEGQY